VFSREQFPTPRQSIYASFPSSWISTYLPLATSHGNVDETAGVLEALQSTALGLLLLLLLLDLYSRR
jgi:hypothetical protein